MRVKKSILSILLIFVIVLGLLPFSSFEVEADMSVPGKGGAFYTKNTLVQTNLNKWFDTWKDGSKFPYRGNNTNEWNDWGEAQCLSYSREFVRALSKNRTNYGTKVDLNKAFNKANFLAACKGVPAGTHLRFTGWHSVTLLKVTDKMVYWTDCNWDHYNTISYKSGSVDTFVNTYSRGYPMQYIEKPVFPNTKKKETIQTPLAIKYTIKYDANGGTGTMANTATAYGVRHSLRSNSFKRSGYKFEGWNAYRARDNKWIYTNGYDWKWYTEGYEPSGWTKKLFSNGASLYAEWTYINNDVITAKAVWSIPAEKIWKRLWGADRHGTMEAIVNEGFGTVGGTVVVATADGYKDALSVSGFAGISRCPVILTSGKALTSQATNLLKKLKPRKVFIVGGELAITSGVKERIEAITGVFPIRLAGPNSADTSAEIALAGRGNWKDGIAIIATNSGFKDALSAAPVAYAKRYPVLLADRGKRLTDYEINVMRTIGINQVIIVGGEYAVSPSVVEQLRDNGITVKTRLYGQTGVGTSAAIATWALKNGMSANKMGIASSQNYPDALAGAALCGYNNSVLLLADDKAIENASFAKAFKYDIDRAYVFGGSGAVGSTTWDAILMSFS